MTASLTDFSNGLTTAVEKAGASTVLVDARKRYPASGIALAEDLVLTADHVVTREDGIKVMAADGRSLDATIAGRDPGSDLAVLRLPEKALTPAQTSDTVKVGQLVLALGRPNDAGIQASWGIVTAINGPTRTFRGGMLDEFLQSETTPYPGFSGGPLINTEGEVLGLNTSGLTRGSSLTIPVKVAWRTGEALALHGTVKRGYLGVRTQAGGNPGSEPAGTQARTIPGSARLVARRGRSCANQRPAGGRYPCGDQRTGPAGCRRSLLRPQQRYGWQIDRGRCPARRTPGDGLRKGRGEEVIRVLLNVSSPALRAGLRALLSSDSTIKVVNDSLEDDMEADVVITSASHSTLLINSAGDSPSAAVLLLSDDPPNIRDLSAFLARLGDPAYRRLA